MKTLDATLANVAASINEAWAQENTEYGDAMTKIAALEFSNAVHGSALARKDRELAEMHATIKIRDARLADLDKSNRSEELTRLRDAAEEKDKAIAKLRAAGEEDARVDAMRRNQNRRLLNERDALRAEVQRLQDVVVMLQKGASVLVQQGAVAGALQAKDEAINEAHMIIFDLKEANRKLAGEVLAAKQQQPECSPAEFKRLADTIHAIWNAK